MPVRRRRNRSRYPNVLNFSSVAVEIGSVTSPCLSRFQVLAVLPRNTSWKIPRFWPSWRILAGNGRFGIHRRLHLHHRRTRPQMAAKDQPKEVDMFTNRLFYVVIATAVVTIAALTGWEGVSVG